MDLDMNPLKTFAHERFSMREDFEIFSGLSIVDVVGEDFSYNVPGGTSVDVYPKVRFNRGMVPGELKWLPGFSYLKGGGFIIEKYIKVEDYDWDNAEVLEDGRVLPPNSLAPDDPLYNALLYPLIQDRESFGFTTHRKVVNMGNFSDYIRFLNNAANEFIEDAPYKALFKNLKFGLRISYVSEFGSSTSEHYNPIKDFFSENSEVWSALRDKSGLLEEDIKNAGLSSKYFNIPIMTVEEDLTENDYRKAFASNLGDSEFVSHTTSNLEGRLTEEERYEENSSIIGNLEVIKKRQKSKAIKFLRALKKYNIAKNIYFHMLGKEMEYFFSSDAWQHLVKMETPLFKGPGKDFDSLMLEFTKTHTNAGGSYIAEAMENHTREIAYTSHGTSGTSDKMINAITFGVTREAYPTNFKTEQEKYYFSSLMMPYALMEDFKNANYSTTWVDQGFSDEDLTISIGRTDFKTPVNGKYIGNNVYHKTKNREKAGLAMPYLFYPDLRPGGGSALLDSYGSCLHNGDYRFVEENLTVDSMFNSSKWRTMQIVDRMGNDFHNPETNRSLTVSDVLEGISTRDVYRSEGEDNTNIIRIMELLSEGDIQSVINNKAWIGNTSGANQDELEDTRNIARLIGNFYELKEIEWEKYISEESLTEAVYHDGFLEEEGLEYNKYIAKQRFDGDKYNINLGNDEYIRYWPEVKQAEFWRLLRGDEEISAAKGNEERTLFHAMKFILRSTYAGAGLGDSELEPTLINAGKVKVHRIKKSEMSKYIMGIGDPTEGARIIDTINNGNFNSIREELFDEIDETWENYQLSLEDEVQFREDLALYNKSVASFSNIFNHPGGELNPETGEWEVDSGDTTNETYREKLVEQLINKPEFSLFFKYLFPVEQYLGLVGVYTIFAMDEGYDVEESFSESKDVLRILLENILKGPSKDGTYPPIEINLPNLKFALDIVANFGKFAPWAIAEKIIDIIDPLGILEFLIDSVRGLLRRNKVPPWHKKQNKDKQKLCAAKSLEDTLEGKFL
jgi:hypothetical protein